MTHWRLSSLAGLLLTGRYEPVCSIVWRLPDCAARRAFGRACDRAFGENGHCQRVSDTYRIGRALRRGADCR